MVEEEYDEWVEFACGEEDDRICDDPIWVAAVVVVVVGERRAFVAEQKGRRQQKEGPNIPGKKTGI